MTIAESLKRFRKKWGLTQKQIASVLGVSQQTYQVYEGKSVPSASIIVQLANHYNVTADYLLGLSDTPTGNTAENPMTVEVDDEDSNALTIAAESDRILDYHENLAHVLAKQGIKI